VDRAGGETGATVARAGGPVSYWPLGHSTPHVRCARRAALPESGSGEHSASEESSSGREADAEAEAAAAKGDAASTPPAGRRLPIKGLAVAAVMVSVTMASLVGAGGSPALAR
jgi:hypothetical protein